MNKREALDVAITAMFREILREDGEYVKVPPGPPYDLPPAEVDQNASPRPKFDFDESTCEHGGLVIERSMCPIHGPGAMGPAPTMEELDDITGETFDEGNPMIARARRLKEQQARRESQGRLYAEELPMAGMGPPPEDGPPLVV